MRMTIPLLAGVLTCGVLAAAQEPNAMQSVPSQPVSATETARQITLPAGTKVLLQLRSPIDTKSAHPGDGVYCQTAFPVTEENTLVIPAGTYVKGKIMRVERAGRVKGRAEIQVHFTTLIYPNGYSVDLPGSLDNTPGSQHHTVSDKEGTVKADSQKGKDVGDVATWGASGAGVGALSTGSLKGAGIGGGIGAGIGLIKVLASRGQDVRLESGSSLEMVLQRPLTLDVNPANTTHGNVVPRGDTSSLLPPSGPKPDNPEKKRRRLPLPF
jgi:type IV secretion system protein VirB10